VKINCPHCSKSYQIDDNRLSAFKDAISMPCPSCKGVIKIDLGSESKGQSLSSPAMETIQKSEPLPPKQETGMDGDAIKKRILSSLQDLPPMPQVAQKAREVLSNPSSNFADLAKVIEMDQAIATRVLKIANSAYYGLSGKVSSVRQAAVVLGTKTLAEMLNLACSSGILGRSLEGYGLDAGDLWTHSLAVAAGSRIIARRVKPELEQDAFVAGLIHDVGKIILDPYILERKEAFQAFVDKGQETFWDAERHLLGFDHAVLAMEACGKWQIPGHIAKAIQYHHDPAPSQEDILSYTVHTADAIAIMSGIGAGMDGMLYSMNPDSMAILRLGPEDLSELMCQIAEFVEKTTH
jgi:HD-like signal output (HDOD) protein